MAVLEPTVLGWLYRQHAPALRLYARQWPVCAEDAVQDAFVRLARQSPPPDKILPWLYRVVRNQALSFQRSAARRRKREEQTGSSETWFSHVEDQIDGRRATQMLDELALDIREVIVARLWGGLTFEEIARLVDCSLPTAHRRYQAGLAELRERLEGQWHYPRTSPTTT